MSDLSIDVKPSPRVPEPAARSRVQIPSPQAAQTTADGDMQREESRKLMSRLAQGDETAMNELIQLHGPYVSRLVGRLVAWSADQEDVFQDVMVHIWKKARHFKGTGTLRSWLRTLAVRRCQNHLRRQITLRKQLTKWIESFGRPVLCHHHGLDDSGGVDDRNDRLQAALASLKPAERAVLVLYYLEQMPADELAHQLKISPSALHVRLCRARKNLRVRWEIEGNDNE